MNVLTNTYFRWIIGVLLLLIGLWVIPHHWCAREADSWFYGDQILQQRLARGVSEWLDRIKPQETFSTGSSKFDGEWLFGTYVMAGMGFGQTALQQNQNREWYLSRMEHCIERLQSPEVRLFDRQAWDEDPLESLNSENGHAAYLGYFNLLLSLYRLHKIDSKYAALNDSITTSLVRRLEHAPSHLLETYPGEFYPVDNSAGIASIALYDRATGSDHRDLINRWIDQCRRKWIDPGTGLLIQATSPADSVPDPHAWARGSGTSLAVYFLSFADESLSEELFQAIQRELAETILGFGVVREYPRSNPMGISDIDSGPLILGYSISATGFTMAGCRIHNNPELFASLYGTSYLFGAPFDHEEYRNFVSGGPLGNAIMFAMLTALPASLR